MKNVMIGKLSEIAMVSKDTVQFYGQYGPIYTVGRNESNYRLRFSERTRETGFTLSKIMELFAFAKDHTKGKAEDIRPKNNDLFKIPQDDEDVIDLCDRHMEGNEMSHPAIAYR